MRLALYIGTVTAAMLLFYACMAPDTAKAAVMVGNSSGNYLVGTGNPDRISGRRGDDDLEGRGSRDKVLGGDGDDFLGGGTGRDILRGGSGYDVCFGDGGRDRFYGCELWFRGSGRDEDRSTTWLASGIHWRWLFSEKKDRYVRRDIGAPRPSKPCTAANAWEVIEIWDPHLEGFISWECFCPTSGGCSWQQLGPVHGFSTWAFPGQYPRGKVRDRHRACRSIVCVPRYGGHNWRRHRSIGTIA